MAERSSPDPLAQARKVCARKGHRWMRSNAWNTDLSIVQVTLCARCTEWARPDATQPAAPRCYRCTRPATVWVGDVGACARHFIDAQGGEYRIGDEVKPLV